ncbi:YSIRK-type signal peptide-containing protein [Streptococcus pneumoniae]|uniref:YSIRK-type signal peptide-containing protein n=1 Tax=Streptococcus pseudopneumoniae TaxID=257758 RepID=UPI0031240A02
MFYKGNEDREKRLRFSIRKVSFGAASVAVAALFMFPGNGTVSATEQGVTPTNEETQGSPLKDPDVQNGTYEATPVVSQLDENSGASEVTAPKGQEETTTPTSTDASASSVESPTVSKEKEETSTTATPAPVVSSTASATEKAEEKATSDLDKKQLEDYVAEIDAKLASGSYATKTDESVATLKEHLELAKLALTTATSQEELTKAYRRLFMTASSGLRSKPKAQVESPKLDTTEGKATVGKKASNTEKATGTNSIANSGKHDSRNGQALDRNNPFRTDGTTTDTDPSANQTYTAPAENADLKTLADKLKALPEVIENNKKIQNMDALGDGKNIAKGSVAEIKEFGGWKAVGENGKFAIARKTEAGVFPAYTVNITRTNQVWVREQSFDRRSEYILLLSKLVTKQNRDEPVYDDKPYLENNEPGAQTARAAKWFDGIEKTFKAYASNEGTKVTVNFKTGYTGDNNGSKAKYKVEVFSIENGNEQLIYTAVVSPEKNVNSPEMKVVAARDGNAKNQTFSANSLSKEQIEEKLALTENRPNATGGTFTSREINLPKGVTSYKVRISLENKHQAGMSYNSSYLQYSLPITGLDFNVNQDTSIVAKNLLQRIYDKLLETETTDKAGKTDDTINAYTAELEKVRNLLTGQLKTTADYKKAFSTLLAKQEALVPAATNEEKTNLSAQVDALKKVSTENKTPESIDKYNEEFDKYNQDIRSLKEELRTILAKQGNATKDEVSQVLQKVEEVKRKLDEAKSLLVEKGNKTELRKAVGEETTVKGNFKYYNADKTKRDAYDEAIKNGQTVIADANADQTQVDEALKAITEAKKALDGAPTDKEALKTASTTDAQNTKTTDAKYYNGTDAQKQAYDTAVSAAADVISNPNATQTQVDEALKAITEAKKALDGAPTDKTQLINTTDALNNLILEDSTKGKTKATIDEYKKVQEESEKVLKEVKKVIDNENASQVEVDKALELAIKAKDALEIAKKSLLDAVEAREVVETTANEKIASVKADKKLSDEEKQKALDTVEALKGKALESIDNSTKQSDLDKALRTFLYQVDQAALVDELPELNLEAALKALINGVVKVERGTALSQADVLAKLDLPEEISVINMVLPDTNTVGTKVAIVTLRLADGSVQKLEVPVEVISPNNQDMIPPYNGGNYGPSADNGMTNTQAKVNKSKLESAIHQLDELIIQESAKLDAETAKEANALSADAKKVFANADASQAEVDAMVKRIEDFMAKLAPVADHVTPAEDQSVQTPAVAPATAQAADANQEAAANARTVAKELPNTGTADSTVAMVVAAASALLGLGLAGRRRKEDEEA